MGLWKLSVVLSPFLGSHAGGILEDSEEGTLVGETRLKAYGSHLLARVREQQFLGVLWGKTML